MNKTVTPSPLSDEYAIALEIKQQECRDLLLDIDECDSPQIVVGKIADYVDHLLAGNRPAEDLHEYVLQLGSLLGNMIEKEYGWQWQHLRFEGRQGLFLVSPSSTWRHSPLAFINNILTGDKKSEDGSHDNNILPLFKSLHTLEKQASPQAYQSVS